MSNTGNRALEAQVFDSRPCELGEGVLWHPLRKQLFWFDILGKKLYCKNSGESSCWNFDEIVSAAGWIDRDTLLIASESSLSRFDLVSGSHQRVCSLEADNPLTRSNDGRADPLGGFWIGTMSKTEDPGAGAIYRYFKGQLHKIYDNVSIPNSICFTPDGEAAYFSDTPTSKIMRQALDAEGWPSGSPTLFVDLSSEGLFPDGSIIDSEGGLWNAQWGAGRVARYLPEGKFDFAITTGCKQSTCPAFGSTDLSTLYVTSAFRGLNNEPSIDMSLQGVTFSMDTRFTGCPEPRVIMDKV